MKISSEKRCDSYNFLDKSTAVQIPVDACPTFVLKRRSFSFVIDTKPLLRLQQGFCGAPDSNFEPAVLRPLQNAVRLFAQANICRGFPPAGYGNIRSGKIYLFAKFTQPRCFAPFAKRGSSICVSKYLPRVPARGIRQYPIGHISGTRKRSVQNSVACVFFYAKQG